MVRQAALAVAIFFTFWVVSIGGAAIAAAARSGDPGQPSSHAFFGGGLVVLGIVNGLTMRAAHGQRSGWPLPAATGIAIAAVLIPFVAALDGGGVGGAATLEILLLLGLPALANRWALRRLALTEVSPRA